MSVLSYVQLVATKQQKPFKVL